MRAAFCLVALSSAPVADASVSVYARNLAGFTAAAPQAIVAVDFEGVAPGTNLAAQTLAGITFIQSGGAAPIVVNAAETLTPAGFSGAPNPSDNKLIATSGERVLSPGGAVLGPGPNAAVEEDDLTLIFDPPVAAFGFDHISQSADGFSFTSIVVRNAANAVLYSGGVPISTLGGAGAPAGADFWGIVSTAFDIARVEITEGDNNSQFPDCNIGFDTLRVHTSAPPCPADFNQDGGIDGADVEAFFAAWESGSPAGDVNADGGIDGTDVEYFFAVWEAGGCG